MRTNNSKLGCFYQIYRNRENNQIYVVIRDYKYKSPNTYKTLTDEQKTVIGKYAQFLKRGKCLRYWDNGIYTLGEVQAIREKARNANSAENN